ncbi:unnamed protein product [Rhodiola kirilowii]
MDKEVWELFSKVEINIPLLEAIKQIPRYAKFLKELCTNRRRCTRDDQELMSKNVSAIIKRKVPPKCGDPGTYTIPCTIEPAGLTIQLADRSCKQPEGKIEDVLV